MGDLGDDGHTGSWTAVVAAVTMGMGWKEAQGIPRAARGCCRCVGGELL